MRVLCPDSLQQLPVQCTHAQVGLSLPSSATLSPTGLSLCHTHPMPDLHITDLCAVKPAVNALLSTQEHSSFLSSALLVFVQHLSLLPWGLMVMQGGLEPQDRWKMLVQMVCASGGSQARAGALCSA